MTGQSEAQYTARHAAYDLKKLRAKHLIAKMGRSRCYEPCPSSMRTITALQVLCDHVIRPVVASVASTRLHAPPFSPTTLDRHYERLRQDLQPVFEHLGIAP